MADILSSSSPSLSPEQRRYSAGAIVLHWLIALLMIGQLAGGFYMESLERFAPARFQLFQLHKSFGLTILTLTVIRILWRLGHPAPPLPANLKAWERAAAHLTHVGFYVVLLLMPFSGWALVSTSSLKLPTLYFGLFTWPNLPVPGDDFRMAYGATHYWLAWGTLGLLALHLGAVVKHVFILRDNVLWRMLPLPFLKFSRGAE